MKHFPDLTSSQHWEFYESTTVADIYRYTHTKIPHTIELIIVEWRPQDYIVRLQSDACSGTVEQTETRYREIALAEASRLMKEADSLLSKKKTTNFVTKPQFS